MSRLSSLKRLAFAALATAGVVAACRAAQPSEAPPLAPRPEIGEPSSPAPVPGAPDPLSPEPSADAGLSPTTTSAPVSQIDSPIYRSDETSLAPLQSRDAGVPADAGGNRRDAGRLDATSPDAAPPRDAAVDARVADAPPARDAGVPDARDGGVGLPPNPDASFPPDAVRPMR